MAKCKMCPRKKVCRDECYGENPCDFALAFDRLGRRLDLKETSIQSLRTERDEARMYKLKADIVSFVWFEHETSLVCPWACSATEITERHLEDVCTKVLELSADGTWDDDLLYMAVDEVCGINPKSRDRTAL